MADGKMFMDTSWEVQKCVEAALRRKLAEWAKESSYTFDDLLLLTSYVANVRRGVERLINVEAGRAYLLHKQGR